MNERCMGLDTVRRDALMNASFREFASNGYEDASTNRIAPKRRHFKGADVSLYRLQKGAV